MTSDTTETEAPIETGVQFASSDGRRSSTAAGRSIFADAVTNVDPDLAGRIARTKDWRKAYLEPVRSVVERGVPSSKDALRIASDGLHAVREHLTFVDGGEDLSLSGAYRALGDDALHTSVISGEGKPITELEVPYRGSVLRGDELLVQLERWAQAGVLERSAADALELVVRNPEWLDLSDRTFVLLGASSQMGPLEYLAQWRANIVALDLPRQNLWETIVKLVRRGAGTVHVPSTEPIEGDDVTAEAGVDLLLDAPRAARWIRTFDGPLTIGNYVYADGATFVRLAAAVDMLIETVLDGRDDVSLAYLATPTDVFAVPSEVVEGAAANRTGPWSVAGRFIRPVTIGKTFAANYAETLEDEDGRTWGIADSLVPIQGPNYALAKAMQRWRAVVARDEGVTSSANVAPSTRTQSVVKNRMLAAAYKGAGAFGVEIFEPPTSRAIMAALLVHDLRNPSAPSRPATEIDHPYRLFADAAVHGGLWRLGYEPRSILPLALLLGLTKRH